MGIPLPLKQSDNDEHDEDKYEEGNSEADVQGEVAGGDGRVLVGVGDDREVSRNSKVGSAEARGARPAVHVLPLAIPTPVCRGRVGAVPPSHLKCSM